MKLTPKQKRFCDEYLIDLNATQAAIRAGYSKKMSRAIGCENLTKPNIQNYIQERMETKDKELIASQDEVLSYLTGVMRGNEKEEVIVTEGCGDGYSEAKIMEKYLSGKDRIRAAELLGKSHQLFTDKVQVDGNVVVFSGEDELK